MESSRQIQSGFEWAARRYADAGVDVVKAMEVLNGLSISLQCWQGDDVAGFEGLGRELGGGLAVTGCYPGKPRTPQQLRADVEKALSLVPGRHRLNLHASYGEFGDRRVDRDAITPEHFANWIAWARERQIGLDFNPTFFAHAMAADGFTLAHPERAVRQFWIEHGVRCREVASAMGKALETECVNNIWIPDGFKDTPADRKAPRERLIESLDAMFAKPFAHEVDAVEGKLFGIGSESCVVGSHEFYFGYALTRKKLLCLDTGHFHPTESVADKLSAVLQFLPAVLLHVSRGVRWDSDHVVTLTDDLALLAREVVTNGYEHRVRIGLDFFDASINRVAAWVIGTRNVLKALLIALLEPPAIRQAEIDGDLTARLALQEEAKTLPVGAIWDSYCERQGVAVGERWIEEVKEYERAVLSKR